MRYSDSIISTLIFFFILQILSLWILIIPEMESRIIIVKFSSLIDSIIALTLLIIVFRKINGQEILNFKGANYRYYLLAIISGIGFVMTFPILNTIYRLEIAENILSYNITFEKLWSGYAIDLIIFTPIIEELFFRNYIQKKLSNLYKPLNSIMVTALLFSMIHIPIFAFFIEFVDFSMYQAFFALFGGIISGILYYKSKSLIPSILFHMIWNFLILIIN